MTDIRSGNESNHPTINPDIEQEQVDYNAIRSPGAGAGGVAGGQGYGQGNNATTTSSASSLGLEVTNNSVVDTRKVSLSKELWHNPRLVGVIFFSAIGGLLFGYDTGVIGGVTSLDDFRPVFGIDLMVDGSDTDSAATTTSWIVSSFLLGCAAAAIVTGPFSDVWSRKAVIFIGSVVFTIGGVLQASAYSLEQMIIGRVVAGLAIGALSTVIPLYNAEVSSPEIRGICNTLFQLAITAGILLAFLLNLGFKYIHPWGWRLSLGIQSLFSLVMVLGIAVLPESPRFLMMKRREQETFAVLKRIRKNKPVDPSQAEAAIVAAATGGVVDENGKAVIDYTTFNRPVPRTAENTNDWNIVKLPTNTIDQEVEEIRASIIHQEKLGQVGWADIFGTPLRCRVSVGTGVQGFQQLTGLNAISYYSNTIFANVGVEPLLTTAIFGIVNFFVTFAAFPLVDTYGRVPLLLFGAMGMCISSLIVGIVGLYGTSGQLGITMVVFVCIFVACFAISWGPCGWIVPSEIFPLSVRGKGVSLTTCVNWLGNFAISQAVPHLLSDAGVGPTFLLFFAFECLIILFVITMVPETKGVNLEQMDRIFAVETFAQFRQFVYNNFLHSMSLLTCGLVAPQDQEALAKQREANYLANKERNATTKAGTWTQANTPAGTGRMDTPTESSRA